MKYTTRREMLFYLGGALIGQAVFQIIGWDLHWSSALVMGSVRVAIAMVSRDTEKDA